MSLMMNKKVNYLFREKISNLNSRVQCRDIPSLYMEEKLHILHDRLER